MFKNERFLTILDLLQKKKVMRIKDLQKELFVSDSTIRRDLIALEKMGKVTRKFGRVELVKADNIELSFLFRQQENSESKKYIAEIASTFLGDNEAIFVDSSSTTSFLAHFFEGLTNLVVVTNSLKLAIKLDEIPAVKTFIAGGRLRSGTGSILGDISLDFFSDFRADLVFLSCSSINANDVYMSSEEQSGVKRRMMENAERKVLLCDHSKFNVKGYYRLCDVNDFDVIIMDQQPPEEIMVVWSHKNVEVLY